MGRGTGSEREGAQFVLILSNDAGNRHSPIVIAAAAASRVNTRAKLPAHTAVKKLEALNKDSVILLEQMHTIDKQRLKKHIGTLDAGDALAAGNALLIRPGLTKKNEPLRYTVQAVVHILRTNEELSI